jgi:hypothetical protein
MKQLVLWVVCFTQVSLWSQVNDLNALSSGQYLGFQAIFDQDEKLYGYVAQYSYGKLSKEDRKFEIVLLDKNLNKVLNKEIETSRFVESYSSYMNFRGELVLRPRIDNNEVTMAGLKKVFIPKVKVLNLTTNELKDREEQCYGVNGFKPCDDDQNVKELQKQIEKDKKKLGYYFKNNVYTMKDETFLVFEYKQYDKQSRGHTYTKYDENKNKLWTYSYNNHPLKSKDFEVMYVFFSDDTDIYFYKYSKINKREILEIIRLDLKTGKEVFKKDVSHLKDIDLVQYNKLRSYYFTIDNTKGFDDKVVLVSKKLNHQTNECLGYSRMTIDKNTNEVKFDDLLYTSLKSELEVNQYGKFKNGYDLAVRDLFFTKDGGVGFLFEKIKIGTSFWTGNIVPRTTDLIYVHTDAQFKSSAVSVLSKEKSKDVLSDYLFSQSINDEENLVFFYRDQVKDEKTKEKNWKLFINTIIDSKLNSESIDISSDNNVIFPYVAKEGYIMLREFNKKDKYNQIRLERINY